MQNNLQELYALLSLVIAGSANKNKIDLGPIFEETKALESIRTILPTFVLRRRKENILKDLVKKTVTLEHCPMTEHQRKVYHNVKQESQAALRAKNDMDIKSKMDETSFVAVLMRLRRAACHPLLIRTYYKEEILDDMAVQLTQVRRDYTNRFI